MTNRPAAAILDVKRFPRIVGGAALGGSDPCVAYQGCAEGYPVHYCEFNGGHGPQPFASDATWAFFSQF